MLNQCMYQDERIAVWLNSYQQRRDARLTVFMAMKMEFVGFCSVVSCSVVAEVHFNPEDGGSTVL